MCWMCNRERGVVFKKKGGGKPGCADIKGSNGIVNEKRLRVS